MEANKINCEYFGGKMFTHFNIKVAFRIFSIEYIGSLWTGASAGRVVAAHIFL